MKHLELVPAPVAKLHSTIAADLMAAIPCVLTGTGIGDEGIDADRIYAPKAVGA
jgi:hypothetical protein